MNINDEFILSYYQELSQVNEHISLVQHIENKRIYLKKTHALCDKKLYEKLAQLDLEHIPKFYHIIEDAQALIIIEEYISGASLEEILKKEKQLPLSKVLDILVQLCTILAPLHQASPPIIHRDIKPSNILITPKGRVKLIDFNASKEFDPEKTSDTVLMGTVGYAAPEQYGYFQSDARTDIYSLGVLMNKLLTGELPRDQRYEGEGAGILNRAINLAPENRFPDVL
ncbi:MAG: serine/threonine-protein kinase, partial [Anaerovoracaceae bacterium]